MAITNFQAGSGAAASAQGGHHAPPSIAQQAARVKAQDAYTPVNGNAELNVNVLEDQVRHYYGSARASYPGIGPVTIPSSTSNYDQPGVDRRRGVPRGLGDQYSDLLGGDAGHQVKLPNPMYYIP
jgi:hypothetical protein